MFLGALKDYIIMAAHLVAGLVFWIYSVIAFSAENFARDLVIFESYYRELMFVINVSLYFMAMATIVPDFILASDDSWLRLRNMTSMTMYLMAVFGAVRMMSLGALRRFYHNGAVLIVAAIFHLLIANELDLRGKVLCDTAVFLAAVSYIFENPDLTTSNRSIRV